MDRLLIPEAYNFSEAMATLDEAASTITLTIIKPGMSKNSRMYSAAMLKRDHKIFEGAKMFVDHQTEAESKQRPEGSVRNWAATIKKVWCENDGTVKGQATVIDPALKTKLNELRKANQLSDMGVSIRAIGEAVQAEASGQKYLNVERLVKARSVDFVTFPGAGGMVEAMEAASPENDVDVLSEAQLRERRPDLVSLIEESYKEKTHMDKTLEQLQAELAEANTKLATATTQIATAEKAQRIAEAKVKIEKTVSESKLPQPAKDRLSKQFEGQESDAGVADAVKAEEAYIKALGAKTTKVRDMGEADPEGEGDAKVDLAESFGLFLNESEAKAAARGKK